MLYHLSQAFKVAYSFLNVIHYVSFRAMGGLLTAFILSIIFGGWFIRASQRRLRSKAREYTPENHRSKDDMPTMGGLFILLVATVSILLWCRLTDPNVWLLLWCMLGFGGIGVFDDIKKIRKSKGISATTKFVLQLIVAVSSVYGWITLKGGSTTVWVPFLKNVHPELGWLFVVWAVFIIVGTSNGVNLTDGLDGLAIGSLIPTFATFSIIAYLAGHAVFAHYLMIPFAATSEVAIMALILVGSSLGFLWYNTYPAQIFMGDVGSLALGAALGFIALMTKQELVLPLAGGLFVIETLSVIVQVVSYRVWGKRVFKMAPIHHHFELLGWQEAKITTRFGIITYVLCLFALMTLKLR